MMSGGRNLEWNRVEELIPALLTIVTMPFTYSSAHGISAGIVSQVFIYGVNTRILR